MNILILGASSQIGHDLALCFAKDNFLVLHGRNSILLNKTSAQCLLAGASQVEVIFHDLASDVDIFIQKVRNKNIDLIINLVATTSRVKDGEFLLDQIERYTSSDLVAPIKIIQSLRGKSDKALKVIFISSILASVPSPDRRLYGSLKLLQEICLYRIFESSKDIELLVVKVGTVVRHDRPSERSSNLAKAVYAAHLSNIKILSYGIAGRLYVWLFHIQPLAFYFIIKIQRLFRGR
jgi:NAD(P)-dependent dehydrogenase (short-subunit alcohol dehydrogenase family)